MYPFTVQPKADMSVCVHKEHCFNITLNTWALPMPLILLCFDALLADSSGVPEWLVFTNIDHSL